MKAVVRQIPGIAGVLLAAGLCFAAPAAQAAGWTPAAPVLPSSNSLQFASPPALDAAGDEFMAYADNSTIWLVKRPAGGSWGTPTKVVNAAGSQIQLAVDSAGDAVIGWIGLDINTGDTLPYLAAVSAGGVVSGGTQALSTPGGAPPQYCSNITVAENAAGAAAAAWNCPTGTTPSEEVQVVTRGAGGAFGGVQHFAHTGPGGISMNTQALYPAVSVDDAGDVIVAYVQSPYLLYSDGTNGLLAATPYQLSNDSGVDLKPAISSAGTNSVIAWIDKQAPATADAALLLNAPQNGLTFNSTVLQSASAADGSISAAIDAAGDTIVAWAEGTGGLNARAATRPAGGSFSAARDVADGSLQSVVMPTAMVPGGPGIVGYAVTPDGVNFNFDTRTVGFDGTIGSPVTLAQNAATGSNRAAAHPDAAGDTAFAWTLPYATNTLSAVYATAPPALGAISGPASALVAAPAAFSVTTSDPWSLPTNVTWSFGDGATGSGLSATHAYAAPGVYTVTAKATDSVGNTASQSTQITVTAPSPTPAVVCRVPSLTHLTAAQAKSHLTAAHCALGKQTKRRKPRSTRGLKYGVVAQSLKANTTHASGTKVNVTLGWYKPPKPKRKNH
jgi:hypothetical protein